MFKSLYGLSDKLEAMGGKKIAKYMAIGMGALILLGLLTSVLNGSL